MATIKWKDSTHAKAQASLAGATELRVVDDPSGSSTSKKTTLTALATFIKSVLGLAHTDVSDFNTAASAAAPVQSVAGHTGTVTLTHSDITDFNTAASAAAPVQSVASRTGAVVIVSTDLADFVEAAQDATGAMVGNTARVTLTYVDASNSLKADLVAASIDVSTYLSFTNASRLAGRGPTGTATEISVDGTSIEFNGAGLRRTAFTGDVTAAAGSSVLAIAANAVTNAQLAQIAGLSVHGNATNSTANIAAITAGSDGFVLRRSGTALGFGTLAAAAFAAATVPVSALNVTTNVATMLGSADNAAIRSNIGAVNIAGDTMTGNLTVSKASSILMSEATSGNSNVTSQADAGVGIITATSYNTAAQGALIREQHARGTLASPTVLATNDEVFNFGGNGYTGSSFVAAVNFQGIVIAATPSTTDMQSQFKVRLCAAASVTTTDMLIADHASGLQMYGSGNTVIDSNRLLRRRGFTIGTLPSASGIPGASAYVTDSLTDGTFGTTLTAGGSKNALVYSDGTAWRYG